MPEKNLVARRASTVGELESAIDDALAHPDKCACSVVWQGAPCIFTTGVDGFISCPCCRLAFIEALIDPSDFSPGALLL